MKRHKSQAEKLFILIDERLVGACIAVVYYIFLERENLAFCAIGGGDYMRSSICIA